MIWTQATADLAAIATGAIAAIPSTEGKQGPVVTLDLAQIGPTLANQTISVAIPPPAVAFETPTVWTLTWTVLIVAPPYAALDALEPVMTALRVPLDLDTADPVTITTQQGPAPAYQCTTTQTLIHEGANNG